MPLLHSRIFIAAFVLAIYYYYAYGGFRLRLG